MEKEFRLHLRLTEKDRDLCRWRHSVKNKMLTYYICQILTAEMRGEIAFLHGFKGMSASDEPCDIFMRVKDPDIIGFIAAMPENRQNATIKNIIRKHLYSQTAASGNLFFSPVPSPVSARPKAVTKKEFPESAFREERDGTVAEEVHCETDEDREALLALIALGGE